MAQWGRYTFLILHTNANLIHVFHCVSTWYLDLLSPLSPIEPHWAPLNMCHLIVATNTTILYIYIYMISAAAAAATGTTKAKLPCFPIWPIRENICSWFLTQILMFDCVSNWYLYLLIPIEPHCEHLAFNSGPFLNKLMRPSNQPHNQAQSRGMPWGFEIWAPEVGTAYPKVCRNEGWSKWDAQNCDPSHWKWRGSPLPWPQWWWYRCWWNGIERNSHAFELGWVPKNIGIVNDWKLRWFTDPLEPHK